MPSISFQGHSPTKNESYRCLEAFEVWGQDWVVDARKFLDAFQDFSMVSHLGAKGDIANSPPRQQRARGAEKAFSAQNLCSPGPLEKKGLLQRLRSPQGFFTTCLTADEPEGSLAWKGEPVSSFFRTPVSTHG